MRIRAWLVCVAAPCLTLSCSSTEATTSGGTSSGASSAKSAPPAASSAPQTRADASTKPSAAPSAEPPPPYDGKLTIAMIMGADRVANPFDPWDEAMAKLEKRVGKPTETHDAKYCWAAVEGDKCAYFCIDKTDFKTLNRPGKTGPAVGATDHPQTVGADMDVALEHCTKLAKK